MHWIDTKAQNKLIVTSYPLILVSGVLLLMIVATVSVIVQGHDVGIMDAVIFYGVGLGFSSIHKYKKMVFDRDFKNCTLYARNIFKEWNTTISWDSIDTLEMVYGGGGRYARGGVLYLMSGDDRHQIIDSDIQPGHEQKSIQAQKQIEAFIGH